jgi:hypothetical protein
MYGDNAPVFSIQDVTENENPPPNPTGSLNELDFAGETWGKLKTWADFKIIYARSVDQDEEQVSVISGENKAFFTQTDMLKSEEEEVNRLLLLIKIFYQKELADILFELHNISKEEEPDYVGMSSESLNNFYNFLQKYRLIKLPNFSLSPEHNIYASWEVENSVVSIHFLQNKSINFVIFKTNFEQPDTKERSFGTTTINTIDKMISGEIIKKWIEE